MKTNFLLRRLYLIIMLFIVSIIQSQAQQPPDCPPSGGNSWDYKYDFYESYSGPDGTVYYYTRTNLASTEIVVDWTTFIGSPRYKDETVKDMLTYDLVLKSAPNCPFTGSKFVDLVYKSDCKMDVNCWVKTDQSAVPWCCDPTWTGPSPNIVKLNGTDYFAVTKTIICGYKCCEKHYEVICKQDQNNNWYKFIRSITTLTYPNSFCSGASILDCLTNQPIPCTSGCQ